MKNVLLFFSICCCFLPSFAQENSVQPETKDDRPGCMLLGKQDPATLLQSVSTVSGDRLLHRPTFQMEGFLDGTLPGLHVDMSQGYPSEKAGLKMRGRNLLIVVDGIPRSDANIPASQIESVSIIKDGLGLAAWGMSSGDGILYVKTKRGNESKLRIDFTAQLANMQQIFRPEFLEAYDYASLLNQALINDGEQPLYLPQDLELYKSGASPYTHPNVDWYDLLLRNNAPVQQYNLNMAGGNALAKYFIDLNVFDQQGFLKQDKAMNAYDTQERFKKYSLRTNVDIRLTERTLLQVNLFGQMFRENTPGKTMMGQIYNGLNNTPNNAYPATNPEANVNQLGVETTYGGNSYYKNNLLASSLASGYIMYPKTDFNIDFVLEHRFDKALEGLYVKGTYSYNSSYREELARTKGFEVWQYTYNDDTKPIDSSDNYTKIQEAGLPSSASGYSRLNRLQYLDLATGYDFAAGDHHSKNKFTYWFNEFIPTGNNLPMIKQGFNLRSEYDFDKRYMAEVSLSTMSLNYLKPGKQWGFFPAAGLGWKISEEAFFDVPQINSLKLRTTYGLNGNDGTGAFFRNGTGNMGNYYFSYFKLYNGGGNVLLGQTASSFPTLIESSIPFEAKYAKTARFSFGADAEVFDQSLTATVEYFNDYHYDILQVNMAKGYNSLVAIYPAAENIGAYRHQGLEVNLDYSKQLGEWLLQANVQTTIYRSTMLANGEPKYPEPSMQAVGKSRYQQIGYVADGFFQSPEDINDYLANYATIEGGYIPEPGDLKYKDINGDHIIDFCDQTTIGTNRPRIEYGIYINAEWKGLGLNMQWSGVQNARIHLQDLPFSSYSGTYGQALKEQADVWSDTNPNARYPRVSAKGNAYNQRTSSFWMKDASYLRLKNIELSYALPKLWMSSIHLSGIKFFVNAYNLLTLSPLEDRDPELIYFSSVPNMKAYNCGINIQF
ncbi:MAG: SusC/RagA family TonB-linked outer membrane protein [Candidatus Symbiothrix sp.]|nr:SusC/RagA family TonB-linked outer membrane protein [Candidatus Symbiothrix sp.]